MPNQESKAEAPAWERGTLSGRGQRMKLCACAAGDLGLTGEHGKSTAQCQLPRRVAEGCKHAGSLGQTAGEVCRWGCAKLH